MVPVLGEQIAWNSSQFQPKAKLFWHVFEKNWDQDGSFGTPLGQVRINKHPLRHYNIKNYHSSTITPQKHVILPGVGFLSKTKCHD